MQIATPPSFKLAIATLTLGMIAAFTVSAWGQEAPAVHVGNTRVTGLPDDWSHHHQVFSNPGTEEDSIRRGTHDRWQAVVNDPRYVINQMKRGLPVQGPAAEDVKMRYREDREDWEIWNKFHHDRRDRRRHRDEAPDQDSPAFDRDWSMNLGGGGHMGVGQYPAKYNFSITSASCNDYVVFPTGLAGGASQATIVAYDNLYATTCGTAASRPNVAWAYNTLTGGTGNGGLASLSPVVSYDGSQVAYIQQVAGAAATLVVLKPSPITGANAASPSAITWYSNATYLGCGAPCYTTITLNGSPTDTNSTPYVDYQNDLMYVGDNGGKLHKFTGVFNGTPSEVVSGTAPIWPISVSGNILTSPVYDTGTSGNIFVADSGGFLYSYKATTAVHQMTSSKLTYASGTVGIVDSPMVDSSTQEVYVFVGDDASTSTSVGCDNAAGCTGVFQFAAGNTTVGTGACTTTSSSSWNGAGATPNCGVEAVFGAGTTPTPTTYDGAFDQVYQGGTGNSGYLWACVPHAGSTPRLGYVAMQSSGSIVPSGVIVVGGTAISALTSAQATCSPLTEFYNTGNASAVATFASTIPNSGSSTTITVNSNANIAIGNYIEVGSEIMLVTNTSGGTSITVSRAQLGTSSASHSAGSIIVPAVDYIYFSVTGSGNLADEAIACSGACLYSAGVGRSGAAYTGFTVPTNGQTATGGTSGIIIDNTSTTAGESQIYYTTLGNQSCVGNGTSGNGTGGCAVQASQSAP
ncbi:MAG: hypothetical protein ACLQVL_03625 [Terriglobia bacterium]